MYIIYLQDETNENPEAEISNTDFSDMVEFYENRSMK